MAREDLRRFKVDDLVLKVRPDVDRQRWNEDRYETFLDILCGDRDYQKEAIRTALRFVLGGEYKHLRALAKENWEKNGTLEECHGTWSHFERHLQLPDKLSATLDLATGTGKSYVMYGLAAILLAEGVVERVLVLCPSTTIESGLLAKFKQLAGNSDLEQAMPVGVHLRIPHVIQATETITPGSICIENRDAVYAHVKSSIRDSLWGKGARVAVLNDEAHHVANEPDNKVKRWKEFLENPEYGFQIILGFSGTCYVGNNYFSDVIYRYSLRRAIEEQFLKKVKYLSEIARTGEEDEDWQLRVNMHAAKRKELKARGLTPLSIVVTPTIQRCREVGEELYQFLTDHQGLSEEAARAKILVVYNNAPDVPKLAALDDPASKVEWVVSVSMLNEGWDVRRVFQIVPHEERAFNSKLLIAQVLGRGLRVPDGWKGQQAEVVVFNHANWAPNIRQLVNELLETEKTLSARVLPDSPYHFELHNLSYNVSSRAEEKIKKGPFDFLTKGRVDIPTEVDSVEIGADFTDVVGDKTSRWKTTIKRKTYTPEDVANQMYHALLKLDMESETDPLPDNHTHYAHDFPFKRLLEIVRASLGGLDYCTESNKQKLLQALGSLRRKKAKIVRYELDPEQLFVINSKDKPQENASASQLRRDKIAFMPSDAEKYIEDEQLEFFHEVAEDGGIYRHAPIGNRYDLKSPVSMVFADSENERKFIRELLNPDNHAHFDAWIKSTSMNFYSIDYAWRKGENPKRGKFNPDFFIKIGDLVLVIEIKDADEISNPSPENIKKYEFATAHFARINQEMEKVAQLRRYSFHFITPTDYPDFFSQLRKDAIKSYRSRLDVKLSEALEVD